MSKKVVVALSGCGVYDGAEIHESVLTLLALDQKGISYQCAAPDENQFHVVNHTNGEEMEETRNILVEAARIARGNIKPLSQIDMADYDGLVIPGGFGSAKNFSKWAFEGPEGPVQEEIAHLIRSTHALGKPIAALCMSPVVLSLAFKGSDVNPALTVGTTQAPSPYEIQAISDGMESLGSRAEQVAVEDVVVDQANRVVTSPCYMMEASIADINEGIQKTVAAFEELL
ncbi:isoprenoid biosynthesis glyoxalase ElbB [bacterium SCSIO 12741]|nr:isoprenoid biosynthesis glyoxalase ElbB [bacterium SCSIO 12741]